MLDGWPTFDGQVYAGQRRRGGCPIFRVPCEKWGDGSAARLRSSTLRPRAVVASAATIGNRSCEPPRLRHRRMSGNCSTATDRVLRPVRAVAWELSSCLINDANRRGELRILPSAAKAWGV